MGITTTEPLTDYTLRWVNCMADLPRTDWDRMAQPLNTPFFEWFWLNSMETSKSTIAQTGWLPNHLTVWCQDRLVAAAPLYLKGHSRGEFVFDHQWADLADQLEIDYYPKLLGMSPFTPAEGYRFLMAAGEDEATLTQVMVAAIDQFCVKNHISGCHFLYADPSWRRDLESLGFHRWLHHSYIWKNEGYSSFDDYLARFNANQRRNIKRERKSVAKAGLHFEVHTGKGLSEALCNLVYDFYSDTCDKFGWWGSKYLTRQFFQQLYPGYCDRTVVFAAYADNSPDPIGMSFCLTKGDRLYGRYWGAFEEFNHLHFNACYYEPIDWAIANGIQLFDPGAGGRHKKRRGFPAAPNHSLHKFYHPTLAQVLDNYIDRINAAEQHEIDAINADLPLKPLAAKQPESQSQAALE